MLYLCSMAKVCLVDSCNNPVWGKGYCKWHQTLRTDKKPKGLSRGKKLTLEAVEEKKELQKKDWDFYIDIWNTCLDHICFECNKHLGNEPLTLYFHHILEKRNHPEFRHESWNIVLLCADCHTGWEMFPNERRFPNLTLKTKELREDKL